MKPPSMSVWLKDRRANPPLGGEGRSMNQNIGCTLAAAVVGVIALVLAMFVYPQYRVYSQRLSGEAALAEAQSSRQVAILEARAKKESAIQLAEAEVIRARGAAQANAILQNSLGGPEGYLRYLQIQALESSKASLIYVPTEAGLPVTESRRLSAAPAQEP
ncbi:SPFH domain-containing protein [Sphingomonas hengshuiensis]|nr:membrane protease subunit [Sphingomonas hengshuiensis]